MIFLLRFVSIFCWLTFCLSIFFSCGLKNRRYLADGLRFTFVEAGWASENAYKIQVYGQWDRARYHIKRKEKKTLRSAPPQVFPVIDQFTKEEDQKPIKNQSKTIEKDFVALRADAKIAAKVKAVRDFRQEIILYLKKASKVEDEALIAEIVDSSLENVPISLKVVKERYSKNHDVVILFHFHAKSLRTTTKKMVDEIVRRSQGKESNEAVKEAFAR